MPTVPKLPEFRAKAKTQAAWIPKFSSTALLQTCCPTFSSPVPLLFRHRRMPGHPHGTPSLSGPCSCRAMVTKVNLMARVGLTVSLAAGGEPVVSRVKRPYQGKPLCITQGPTCLSTHPSSCLFVQHILTECLLCAKDYSEFWEYSREEGRQCSFSTELKFSFRRGETDNK